MPTYEYVCRDCGKQIEVVQRFTDDPLTICVSCGGQLRKVFYPAGILLKGSGFYKTDNRSARKSSDGESRSSDSKPKSETKTDSKTPAKEKTA